MPTSRAEPAYTPRTPTGGYNNFREALQREQATSITSASLDAGRALGMVNKFCSANGGLKTLGQVYLFLSIIVPVASDTSEWVSDIFFLFIGIVLVPHWGC